MKDVAIIGGGITGLTVAHAFEQHNKNAAQPVNYVLIERANRLGGKVVTDNIDGFVVEAGPDCFVAEKPWVGQLATKLGIKDRLLSPNASSKRSFIYSKGKIHELPEGLLLLLPTKIIPFLLSPLISWQGKMRMACDAFIPKKKNIDDETLSSFVQRRLGKEILDKIAAPLIAGIHSNNPETMSLKASFPRFLKMEEEYGSLIKAMLATKVKASATKSKGSGSYFLSFRQGMGEISDALISNLEGHRILTNRTVVQLESVAQGDQARYRILFENERDPIEVDAIVITTVANQAARIVEGLDHRVAGLLREIPLTSSVNLSLAFKSHELGKIPDGFGMMIPAIEKRKISALTLSSTKWSYRVPDGKYSLLRVFAGGYRNQDMAFLDDKELIKVVRNELSDLFGITAAPSMTRIHRWIEERPQYSIGHIDRVKSIENRLSTHHGLFLAGCSYHGIGLGDCVASGLAASKALIEYCAKPPET